MSKLNLHGDPLIVTGLLLMTQVYTSTKCNAQTTPKRTLLAISKTNHTLAVVDPASLNILARIPVGKDPHELVASADGKTAYVCIYGGGNFHEINIQV